MGQSLFFNKVAGLRPATLLKKSLWHRCFPVNFEKFLRKPFSQNTSGRLLLDLSDIKMKRSFIFCSLHRNQFQQCNMAWHLLNLRWIREYEKVMVGVPQDKGLALLGLKGLLIASFSSCGSQNYVIVMLIKHYINKE